MLTIRYENAGLLIYSFKQKNYYFTSDENIIKECKEAFKDFTKCKNKKLKEELEILGIEDGIREVNLVGGDKPISVPLEYYFDFTSKCNLRCKHCYNKDNISSVTMENKEIKRIIKDMYDCGIMRIHLAGGEPTCELEGLDTYMSTAKKYGIVSSMSSNGVSLSDETLNIMLKNDLFSITISLEGANEEDNAKIRGKGNFSKSVETVKRLVELKKKLKKDTIICLKMSYYTDISKEKLEEMVLLGIKLGVNVVKFANPERCIFHEKGFYGKVYDEYYKVMKYVKELKEKYGDKIYISDVANPVNDCGDIGLPNMKGCIGAQELIAINPDGRISPCLMNQINLGNIKDYKSIRDFFETNEKLKDYLKTISNYDCNKCDIHSKCRGGCQVRKYVEYGKIEKTDPLCPIKTMKNVKSNKIDKNLLKKVNVLHSL